MIRHKLVLFTFLVYILSMRSSAVIVHSDSRAALVVGVDGGKAKMSNDAVTMQQAFEVLGYSVSLLLNEEATVSNVLEAIPRKDLVILCAHGPSQDTLRLYDDILTQELLESVLQPEATLIVVACRSGSWIDTESQLRITACNATESTIYVQLFANSIFTEYFADRGIIQGLADANNDTVVSVTEAFYYAEYHCMNPPGALSATHPLMSTSIVTPWFSNLGLVLLLCVFLLVMSKHGGNSM